MDLSRLQEMVALSKNRSFRKTAESFFLTQATLSNHIKALEHELGFEVIDRTKGNELTPLGAMLVGLVEEPMYAISHAIEECKTIADRTGCRANIEAAPVRISSCMEHRKILHVLSDARETAVSFVPINYNEPVLAPFERNEIDVMLNYCMRPFPSAISEIKRLGLCCEPISVSTCAIVMRKDHRLANQELSAQNLDGATLLMTNGIRFPHWRWIYSQMLGPDVHLRYELQPVSRPEDVRLLDLGDMLYMSAETDVHQMFGERNDYIIKRFVDGKPLEFLRDIMYVTDTPNPNVRRIVNALLSERDSRPLEIPNWLKPSL